MGPLIRYAGQNTLSGMAAHPTARGPLAFETSWPGVFAAGGVRHGSTKRVAAAVGEGAAAAFAIGEYLARG